MADLLLLEEHYARVRRERFFGDRKDLLMESDVWLMSRFRLPRHVLLELCGRLEPHLRRETRRSHAIPVPVQVLAAVGFLATGSFQREIGDRAGISQPSISRTMPAVLDAIRGLSPSVIKFPYSFPQQTMIKRQFHDIAAFPNVIGAIDCTHVRLKAPSDNDYVYINRKGHHSINVQLICDASLQILNLVAKWPGGTHDSYIFQNSSVGLKLQEGALQGRSHLLGDRGYALAEHLITPVANPATEQERRFNAAHTRTRVIVERCFGLLKGRWLCLGQAGGTLLYTPRKVCGIVLACGVLHNLALMNGVPFEGPLQPDEDVPAEPCQAQPPPEAIRRRRDLIALF